MSETDRDLLIITGCTRSGMSLTMQMLDAGGFPVFGRFPAYEDTPLGALPDVKGCAIKCPDTRHWTLPYDRCKAIYCKRDRKVQAKSMMRWLRAFGVPVFDRKCLMASIESDDREAQRRLANARVPVLVQPFEELVRFSKWRARQIAAFCGRSLDIEAMVAAVKPRGPGLHPTLLELELLSTT